jgi:hypothetical protein
MCCDMDERYSVYLIALIVMTLKSSRWKLLTVPNLLCCYEERILEIKSQ